jgi:hypothetical protein
MEGWLPPRAPGAKPPPRFDAVPPAAPADGPPAEPGGGEPAADEGAPSGWQPPRAPSGWQPPAAAREAAPPAPAGPGGAAAPPRAQGPGRHGAAATPNTTAVWALVLGITGLVLLLLSFGTLFLLTLPCSAAAWALARRAAARVERGETGHGLGQATAALWLGRIGVVAGVAAMVAFIALTLSGFDFEAFREDLERDLERRRESAR